ncbi:MAG: hypothetical protein ACJA1R_000223, partial [Flavobacteriales bacterium]
PAAVRKMRARRAVVGLNGIRESRGERDVNERAETAGK